MADTPLTDDYVASLLAKDAKESSIKYSAMGMDAFLPSKPPANKPKPNTRFLRTIIRETDNHNAALLAKEASDSRARLKDLEVKKRPAPSDIRRRQLGLIASHLTSSSSSSRNRNGKEKDEKSSRRENTSNSEDQEPRREEKSRSSRRERERNYGREQDGDRAQSSRKRRRSRSRSPERSHHSKRRRSRSRTRSRSPRERDHRHKEKSSHHHSHRSSHRLPRRSESPVEPTRNKATAKLSKPEESDSDPLEEIVGPLPPKPKQIRSRGRGFLSGASGIDSRFSEDYDPNSDVALDDPAEGDDWENALEALRDRQRWKAQGAERLRAAGFTDEQVQKWEKSGDKTEKSVEEVRWAKKGEGREWDRGKVVGLGGIFGSAVDDDVVSEKETSEIWGRLKGT